MSSKKSHNIEEIEKEDEIKYKEMKEDRILFIETNLRYLHPSTPID